MPVSAVKVNRDGVCRLCASHGGKTDWDRLEADFARIADGLKMRGGRYDCMVPITGGKDSSFVLHYVRNVRGLNPLAFTWDNGMIRKSAWRNIERAVKAMGIDHEVVKFDPDYWKRTLRATLRQIEKVCFCPMFVLLSGIPVAVKHGIPAIITGFSEGQRGLDHSFTVPEKEQNLKDIRKLHEVWPPLFRQCVAAHEDADTTEKIMDNFFGPMERCLAEHAGPDAYPVVIPLANYVNWMKRRELENILNKSFGWRKAARAFVHTSCFIEPVKGYLEFTGNMNEIHHELSYLVRGGFMTRGEALAELDAMNVNGREPEAAKLFVDFLSISIEEFREIVRKGPPLKVLGEMEGITPRDILGTVAWCMGNKDQIVDYAPK